MNNQQYDKSLYVLDNHCHVSFPQPIEETLRDYKALLAELAISEAGFLSCPVSSHNETGMDVLENMKALYLKDTLNVPVFAYAGFTEHWDDPRKYAEFANIMLDMGFDGFKSLEEHPKDRKNLGKGLPHPSFAKFFEVLDEKKLPIVCHVGDPRPNWAEETAYKGAKELGRVYGDEFLALDELYGEMEEVIAKYPNIKFILAHFYFISDNYERACWLMEQYPQVYFDLTPGGEMFVNFSKNPEVWREFFIRYRKRIIMGSDHYAEGYGIYRYDLARTFLEGTEPTEHRGFPVLPIHLPKDVLEDIYCNNIKSLTGDTPKPVDRQKAYDYCCYIRDNLIDQLTEMGKANLKTIMEHFQDLKRKSPMKRVYPNIWGRGALFAFSGLEGCTTYEGSMCGQLLGHRIGMSFDKDAAQLHMRWFGVENYDFLIVASDIILGTANEADEFGFLFVNENTVLGFCKKGQAIPVCQSDLLMPCRLTDGICYSNKTVCYALVQKKVGEQLLFAFSRGATEEQATYQARKALETDISAAIEKKLAWFDKVPVLEEESLIRNKTLAKTFSVMKSQVYTPEDMFHQRWTTPDRLPHKKCWLWDSVFHALGNYYIEPQLARESIMSVFDAQQESGFIPHMFWPGNAWTHTQAPVLAWGVLELYQRDGKMDWILPLFEKLENYLNWNINNRDNDRNGLFEWFVDLDEPNCRCGESGCDNSPRFDDVKPMDAIDFSCFMANEFRCMSKLAEALDMAEKVGHYDKLYDNIKAKINNLLFDPVDGRYYDRELESGKLRKVSAVTSFLPLFAGICSPEQAAVLVKDLQDPNTFGTPFGVPSIAKTDPTYGTDMWRGPVWINFNYFIILGLREYGYEELAESLRENTLQQIEKWYQNDGVIYEFYDCDGQYSPSRLARKAVCLNPADDTVWVCAIRDYGWSNTLYAAMVLEG